MLLRFHLTYTFDLHTNKLSIDRSIARPLAYSHACKSMTFCQITFDLVNFFSTRWLLNCFRVCDFVVFLLLLSFSLLCVFFSCFYSFRRLCVWCHEILFVSVEFKFNITYKHKHFLYFLFIVEKNKQINKIQ